jgi:hypothetical protein
MMVVAKEDSQAPVSVQWPLLYANTDLIGKGTLLTVTNFECVVAGTMPVAEGMLVKMWISPEQRNDALYVKAARVLWVRQNKFGIELVELDAYDQRWLTRFVQQHADTGSAL